MYTYIYIYILYTYVQYHYIYIYMLYVLIYFTWIASSGVPDRSVTCTEVTRLSTLQRAASLCGHDPLLELVEAWKFHKDRLMK